MPGFRDQIEPELELLRYQRQEHEAWLEVVDELRASGVGDINAGGKDERLHDVIVRWAEELVQLRLHDPNPIHAADALTLRREKADGESQ